jgi:outer membrane protein TolC
MKKKILIFVIAAFAPFVLAAQETLSLSLEQAIEIALTESPTIKIAEQEIQRVDYSRKSAWYDVMPSLSATGDFTYNILPSTMPLAGNLIESPEIYNASGTLTAQLPIFAPALWKSISMTKLDMQLAVEQAQASKIDLKNSVTKAYYSVLLAQDVLANYQSALTLAEEMYTQSKQLFEQGVNSEFDMISAEVQVKNLQPNILAAENAIEQTKLMLKVLIGLEMTQAVDVTGSLADYENEANSESALPDYSSLADNSELKQLDIQKMQLEKALSIQRTQRMPTLGAFASYIYAGTSNKESMSLFGGSAPWKYDQVLSQLGLPAMPPPVPSPASTTWYRQAMVAGLQLNIPLSGILTNITKERQTKVQINQLSMQRDYVAEQLSVQARTAANDMLTAIQQVEAAKSSEALAQKGYNIARKRFESGVGIVLEVQNAQQQLLQAQLGKNQAIASYLNAQADLKKVLGQ